jgi:hypothetical protein
VGELAEEDEKATRVDEAANDSTGQKDVGKASHKLLSDEVALGHVSPAASGFFGPPFNEIPTDHLFQCGFTSQLWAVQPFGFCSWAQCYLAIP